MKTVPIYLEDEEHEMLKRMKGPLSWRDFVVGYGSRRNFEPGDCPECGERAEQIEENRTLQVFKCHSCRLKITYEVDSNDL